MASRGTSCHIPNGACCYNVTTYPTGVYNYVLVSFQRNGVYLHKEDRQGYNSSSRYYEEALRDITENKISIWKAAESHVNFMTLQKYFKKYQSKESAKTVERRRVRQIFSDEKEGKLVK